MTQLGKSTGYESNGTRWSSLRARLKTENCYLKIFVEIRVGEKMH